MIEVWLRGGPVKVDPLRHLLLCTFEQAREEVAANVTEQSLWRRPFGMTPLGFHIRHIAGSVDRLLTYAEGGSLSESQLMALESEAGEDISLVELSGLLAMQLDPARVLSLDPAAFTETRYVGRKRIAVPLGTLLAHIAEHTQRHLGQIATTAKLIRSL